jgi:hypothetical protein
VLVAVAVAVGVGGKGVSVGGTGVLVGGSGVMVGCTSALAEQAATINTKTINGLIFNVSGNVLNIQSPSSKFCKELIIYPLNSGSQAWWGNNLSITLRWAKPVFLFVRTHFSISTLV